MILTFIRIKKNNKFALLYFRFLYRFDCDGDNNNNNPCIYDYLFNPYKYNVRKTLRSRAGTATLSVGI